MSKIHIKMNADELEAFREIVSHYIQLIQEERDSYAKLIVYLLEDMLLKIRQKLLTVMGKCKLTFQDTHWMAMIIAMRDYKSPTHPLLEATKNLIALEVEPKLK